ncbi:hypothetical protein SKAU_G00090890 [Synaphobranchus kaupii]|uniref:Peptidase M60 domain-containing protein n=1 Tax=Synaphobranchus kaupii TaxID=118154 RepID=A0A9Q1J6F6_SYNKA|nr:hypothetical protein SKAU_G00090890 [Synaphobranchus kaupii]
MTLVFPTPQLLKRQKSARRPKHRKQLPLSSLIAVCSTMSREEIYYALMQGVAELDFRGRPTPSDLALIGDNAIPIAMNPRGQVLMAASTYGKGRLLALGHEDMLTAFPTVMENALRWLTPASDSIVGVNPSCDAILANLCYTSIRAETGLFREGLGVYVTDAYSVANNVKELVAFMKGGGGLLVAGQAWKWAQEHPKENALLGFPGNKVCSVAGIYFSELEGDLGVFPVPTQIPCSWLSVAIDKDFEDDMEFLLQGVSEFDIKCNSTPSEVMVHGPLSFPIAAIPGGRAFFAGSYYGQGRVIVTTHEGYLARPSLEPFLLNAIRWLDEGRNGEVGIFPKMKGAQTLLSKSGLTCTLTNFRDDLSVYVCTSYSNAHAAEIQDFILNRLGLSILGNYLTPGVYKAPEPGHVCTETYRFRSMLKQFAGHVSSGQELTPHEQSCLQRLGCDCVTFLRMRTHDLPSYTSVLEVLTGVVKKSKVPQICPSCPVKEPKDHLLLNMATEVYKASTNPDELLPYIIQDRPDLPLVYNTKVKIDGTAAGGEEWKSTGLYLSPGMRTHMAIPPQIVKKGWKVQIGCQTDNIGRSPVLKRATVVYERFDIDSEMIQVFNLWGGLIYLVAPSRSEEGELEIIVEKAIPAPYYKSGVTTVEAWVGGIRDAPAPWAEFEFENIIMTMPSTVAKAVDRPDEVAELWDSIMRAVADLAAMPAKFARKERYVAEVQISHGWMHAGYPIMMHSASALSLVNPKLARTNGIWGAIHELGHNQQRGGWEFRPHTTECTCNLWSIYVHETVLGMDRTLAHGNLKVQTRKIYKEAFQKDGSLAKWSVWIALETYIQLQEEFGWDAFKKVFGEYQHMKNVPKDNHGKMNLYAETFSRAVNKNLAPFFKAWCWPIRPDTEQKLADLPEWSDHPMSKSPS